VGKKPFRRKRNIILRLDDEIEIKPDTYIPIGTEYVFSKKSTKSESYQIDYWSLTDRESYLKFVQNTISKFLTPEQDERN